MPDDGKLYEQDFYAWGNDQAKAIRAAQAAFSDSGTNNLRASLSGLDWENLAEEIESLSRKDRRELLGRIVTVIEHLIKLQFSPAEDPRTGWRETVRRSRQEIAYILDDSPSLRSQVGALAAKAHRDAHVLAADGLSVHGEIAYAIAARRTEPNYTQDQILDDWWPETPA